MSVDQFVAKYNGKSLDYDGWYGAQCVDLVLYYLKEVTGAVDFHGNAHVWYDNYGGDLAAKYDRIPKSKGTPKKGDIVVWSSATPGSGGAGHIAVFLSGTKDSFTSFDQNWGGQYCQKVKHDGNHVLGYLRRKGDKDVKIGRGTAIRYLRIRLRKNPVESQIVRYANYTLDQLNSAMEKYRNSAEFKTVVRRVENFPAVQEENAKLKAQLANADEANLLGRAIIPILAKLGYKK